MTQPPSGPNGHVYVVSAARTPIGKFGGALAGLRAGLPDTTSATTINRVCGSGLKAIMLAAAEIRAGDAEVAVAGGMESMNGRLTCYRVPALATAWATPSWPVRCRNRAGDGPRCQGPRDAGDDRRGPPARHQHRGAGAATTGIRAARR